MESWLSTESYIALECGSNFKAVLRFEPAYLSIYLFIYLFWHNHVLLCLIWISSSNKSLLVFEDHFNERSREVHITCSLISRYISPYVNLHRRQG